MRPTWRAVSRSLAAASLLATLLVASACGSGSTGPSPDPGPGPGPGPGPTPQPGTANVLVGAGDIALCDSPGSELTAKLLDTIDGTVFTAGDNAYPNGAPRDFQQCYQPSWGRHLYRTRPTPGNHDYLTDGAAGYFGYYGDRAGPSGRGYYSYTVGAWKIYALDSEIAMTPGSPQLQWLQQELASNPSCSVAIWHRPLYTSGPNGENRDTRDMFRMLYTANVDVVINGHDHIYERFAPQDPDGRADTQRGIREFLVGTGGYLPYDVGTRRPNSEFAQGGVWGVLKVTLNAGAYDWEFIPAGAGARDAGTGTCH